MASYNPMKKNTAQRIVFPILDADGDPVTGATTPDTEYSLDGASFTDIADEAHEIATASGIYYVDLAQGETNGDVVAIQCKTATSGAKTTVLVFYTTSTTLDAMQTELNKIGTIVNTGGTATIGALLGDFANSTLVTRVGAGAAQAASYTSTRAGYLDNLSAGAVALAANYSATRAGYLDNINNAQLLNISAAILGRIDAAISTRGTSTLTVNNIIDEALAGHTTADSLGLALKNLLKVGKNKWAYSGTTFTIYDDNGTSTLYQFTLDSATAPTSRTPV